MSMVFKDHLFEAQWLRAVGHSAAGGAEIGECLAAARLIREPDAESWYRAWNDLSEHVLAQAESSRRAGRLVSARSAYLRASNYFRAAYTFLVGKPVSARLVEAYQRHRTAFGAAAALMAPPAEWVSIPCGGTTLHGYCFRAADDSVPRPTLIINGGYDSTAEEAYFFSGRAAVERGYTCITFDGPGQGAALIEHGQVFRPDWEAVVTPVIDYALTRADVDGRKVALMGISFGGYLLRARRAVTAASPRASPTRESSPSSRSSRAGSRHSSRGRCPTATRSSSGCSTSSSGADCAIRPPVGDCGGGCGCTGSRARSTTSS
jgi:hypothetical protein